MASKGAARTALSLLVAVLAAGCGSVRSPTSAAEPTLRALVALGYPCSPERSGDIPAGLTRWRCPRTTGGVDVAILVDAGTDGVGQLRVHSATPDASVARDAYLGIARTVAPLSAMPELARVLDGWDGHTATTGWDSLYVSADCDLEACWVLVSSAYPSSPLPIPSR